MSASAVVDALWAGVPGQLQLERGPTGIRCRWVGETAVELPEADDDVPTGARRVADLVGVDPRDCVLAANGAHDLGLLVDATWLTGRFLDRLAAARFATAPFPLTSPVWRGDGDLSRFVSVPVATAIVASQPLLAALTDEDLDAAWLSSSHFPTPPVLDRIDPDPRVRIERWRRSTGWSERLVVRAGPPSPSRLVAHRAFDRFPVRRGFLPGRRPVLERQWELHGSSRQPAVDPQLVARLGLSKAHELAWAVGLIDQAELDAGIGGTEVEHRLGEAYGTAGVSSPAVRACLIDELAFPATVARALQSLEPSEPPLAGSEQGQPDLDQFAAVVAYLQAEHRLRQWRARGALIRCRDLGFGPALGTGIFLFRRPTAVRMNELVALAAAVTSNRGGPRWADLVDLRAGGVGSEEVRSLASRGYDGPDTWVVAHRAVAGRPRADFVRPACFDAETIEERIDELTLARIWEAGVRDLEQILRLHRAGLGGGDVERFRSVGVRSVGRMIGFARQGVDGFVARRLVDHGHRRIDRWPRLSPYGAVSLEEWMATFGGSAPAPRPRRSS